MLCLRRYIHCSKYLRNIHSSIYLSCTKSEGYKNDLKSLLDNSVSYEENDPESDRWTTPVYPGGRRNRSQQSKRPSVDPTTTSVILFPGQGTQYVGMANSLIEYPCVTEMFESASEILRYNLLDLCINGPIDMLNMTVHSQVAVMVSSLAAVEKLRSENIKMVENCVATAGFSVGEYAALVFAGALEFEDAVKLLKVRGEAMQAASDMEPSGMMTVFLTTQAKIKSACASAREWCEKQGIEDPECQVAIHMFPHCKVVAGHMEALKYLELNAANVGIKKIKYIPVSGAFHSKLMLPAKNVLRKALKSTAFEVPLIPVHSNIDAKCYRNADQIRDNLADQLTLPVAWEQTIHSIFERDKGKYFPNTYECGPGRTLKTILKYNNNTAYKYCENIYA